MKSAVFPLILSSLVLCSELYGKLPSKFNSSNRSDITDFHDLSTDLHSFSPPKIADQPEQTGIATRHKELKDLRLYMFMVASSLVACVPYERIEDMWYRALSATSHIRMSNLMCVDINCWLYLDDLRLLCWISGVSLPEEASSLGWDPELFFTSVREMVRAGEALLLKTYQPHDFSVNDAAEKITRRKSPNQLSDYSLNDNINCILGQNILSYNEASLYKVLGEMARKILETNAHLAAPRGRIHQVLPISTICLQVLAANKPYPMGEFRARYQRLLRLFGEDFGGSEGHERVLLFWIYSMKCYLSKDASVPSVHLIEQSHLLYLQFDNMTMLYYQKNMRLRLASYAAISKLNLVFYSISGESLPVYSRHGSLWVALCFIQKVFNSRKDIITAKLDSQPAHLYQITAQMCSNINAWPSDARCSMPLIIENVRSLNFDIHSVCCTHKLFDYVSAVLWSLANLSEMHIAFPQLVRFDLANVNFNATVDAYAICEEHMVIDAYMFSASDFAVPPKQ